MKAQSNGVVLGNSSLTVVFYVRVRVCRKHTDYRGNAIFWPISGTVVERRSLAGGLSLSCA